jgi:hypothetical protein
LRVLRTDVFRVAFARTGLREPVVFLAAIGLPPDSTAVVSGDHLFEQPRMTLAPAVPDEIVLSYCCRVER